MNDTERPDFLEVAARAGINERCAAAFVHDVRGGMQAVFSAIELLGRSAKSVGGDSQRIEKACALAKRAIKNHEKSTLAVLQVLTLQSSDAEILDLGLLLTDLAHFLRNLAARRGVTLAISAMEGVLIQADRVRFQTLLAGLVTAAIDVTPSGETLTLTLGGDGKDAVVSLDSHAGDESVCRLGERADLVEGSRSQKNLTLEFARRYLGAVGGRLDIAVGDGARGALRVIHPRAT